MLTDEGRRLSKKVASINNTYRYLMRHQSSDNSDKSRIKYCIDLAEKSIRDYQWIKEMRMDMSPSEKREIDSKITCVKNYLKVLKGDTF